MNIISTTHLDSVREQVNAHIGQAARQLCEAGRILHETQQMLDDDRTFRAFLDTLSCSARSAWNYVRLYRHSLRYGDDVVSMEAISVSAWYVLPPGNDEAVQQVLDRARRGERITRQEARRIVAAMTTDSEDDAEAWYQAAEYAPDVVVTAAMTGALPAPDGDDIPAHRASPADIELASDHDAYERAQRQKMHRDANNPAHKFHVSLRLMQVGDRAVFVVDGDDLPAWIVNASVTLYARLAEKESVA